MGKEPTQALSSIQATRAQLQADLDTLRSGPDMARGVMGLVGSDEGGAGASAGAGPDIAEVARSVAPKVLGGLGAVTAGVAVAKRNGRRKERRKALRKERMSARIRAEELARAFGSLSPAPTTQQVAAAPDESLDEADARPGTPPDASGSSRKGSFGLVLLLAVAAGGAAVWLSGRR